VKSVIPFLIIFLSWMVPVANAAGPSFPIFTLTFDKEIMLPGKQILPAGDYVVRILEIKRQKYFKKEEFCDFELIELDQNFPYYFDEKVWADNRHMITVARGICSYSDLALDMRDYFDGFFELSDSVGIVYYQTASYPDKGGRKLYTGSLPVRFGEKILKQD